MKPNKRLAALAVGAISVSGVAAITMSSPALASSQNFVLSSQVAAATQPVAVAIGSRNLAMTVTPSSATTGAPIEVQVTSSDLTLATGPVADLTAGATELDAVISLNGTDYTLRGSAIGQNLPANNYEDAQHEEPTMFAAGWVISSTPGNSSSTSTVPEGGGKVNGDPWASDPLNQGSPQSGTVGSVAGSTGVGATIRGAEGTPVSLTAPGTANTYTITLKALVVNSTTGSSSALTTDGFDQVINDAVQTNTSPGGSNNGPKNSFNNNVASSYLDFTTPVTVTTTAPPAPSFTITDNQAAGTTTVPVGPPTFVRTGDVVTVSSGSNSMWTPSTNWLATICTANDNTGCAPQFTIPALFAGTTGAFDEGSPNTLGGPPTGGNYVAATGAPTNGSGQITPTTLRLASFGSFTGNAYLRISQGAYLAPTNSAFATLNLVTAARTVSGPSEISLNAPYTITGTNFYPGETVTVGDNGGSATTTTTADSSGNFSTSFTPTSSTATAFTASGAGGSATSSAFTISGDNCIAYTGNTNVGGGCATSQNINATVTAGNLSQQANQTGSLALNPDATTIGFGSTPVAATDTPLAGTLNSITVTDLRGGTYPWTLTASLSNSYQLLSGSNSIAGSEITTVAPSCTAGANSATTGITTAPAGANFGADVLLCAKDGTTTGNPGDTNGGIFTAASGLSLNVPAFQAAGVYTGTLTITLA